MQRKQKLTNKWKLLCKFCIPYLKVFDAVVQLLFLNMSVTVDGSENTEHWRTAVMVKELSLKF
jgi:hypothetical protein